MQEVRESLAFQVERVESAFNPISMARRFILAVEAEEGMILRQLLWPEAWVEAVLALSTMDLPVLLVEWRGHQTQVEAAGVVLLPVIGPGPAAPASSSYATRMPPAATTAARTTTTTAPCASAARPAQTVRRAPRPRANAQRTTTARSTAACTRALLALRVRPDPRETPFRVVPRRRAPDHRDRHQLRRLKVKRRRRNKPRRPATPSSATSQTRG